MRRPPPIARALLRAIAPRDDRDFMVDDLDEEFRLVADVEGRATACRWYRGQVFRSIAPMLFHRISRRRSVTTRRPHSQPSGGDFASDLRFAWRGVTRSPGFAMTVIVTLAVGIGANATMFSVLDRLLLRPPAHVRSPDELALLTFRRDVNGRPQRQTAVGYPAYEALRDARGVFASVAVFAAPQDASLGLGAEASRIRLQLVSGDYFATLGTRAHRGRLFVAADDQLPVGQPVAVLGYQFWRQRFGGDSGAIGQNVTIGNHRFEIVGVAPRDFTGTGLSSIDAWIPLSAADGLRFGNLANWASSRDFMWLRVLARRTMGADSARTAHAAALAVRPGLAVGDTATTAELVPVLRRLSATGSPNVRISRLLLAVTGFVLLIACGNVVNLLLARSVQRRQELAVRVALGAGRGRLMRLVMLESLMLSIAGALGALVVARWGGDVVRSQLLADVPTGDGVLDARVLAFTALVTLIAALLTGLAPAWRASRPAIASFLRAGVREGGGQQAHVRATLLVTQAALTVLLLFGTGLLLRSLDNVNRISLGIDAESVMLVDLDLRGAGHQPAEIQQMTRAIAERAGALPGVTSASIALGVPFSSMFGSYLRIPGIDSLPTYGGSPPSFEAVDAQYFRTLGMNIVLGRGFSEAEVSGGARVALVNEALAKRAWPGREALGQCLIVGADSMPCSTVIGVVANAHRLGLMEEAQALSYFVPLSSAEDALMGRQSILLRLDPSGLRNLGALRQALQQALPNLPHVGLQPLHDLLAGEYRPWEVGATLFAVFGGVALLIAAIGWYASLAYDVNQRQRELGVRLALGANPAGLVQFVMQRGLRIATVGLLAGAALALFGVRWLREFLYQVSPADPTVIALVVVVMLVTSVAATLLPAWRAARTDPVEALRGDA